MSKAKTELIDELLGDVEGLLQLATWQLALVREIQGKLATLSAEGEGTDAAVKGPPKRRTRRRKT